jgi:molybdenum cofactor biosynthesis protein B
MDLGFGLPRSGDPLPAARVVVANVARGRASVREDVPQIVIDELLAAGFVLVRNVSVNREKRFVQELLVNLANSNDADALVLVGGVGIGPRDYTCEAVDGLVQRRLEGFGEAYREMLRERLGTGSSALLQRATAGVYNRCLVYALPRQPEPVRLAMRSLVIPTLNDAMRIALGRQR